MGGSIEAVLLTDVHEARSGVPEAVERLGVHVVVLALDVGDYELSDAVVERKTVGDLHDAVAKGRFWRQLGRLRESRRIAYLIVEGRTLDSGPLSPAAVRGVCVATIDLGVRLLRTDDARDTARWLVRLVVRHHRLRSRDRPIYAQRPSPSESPAEGALAAIPGISVIGARALLQRFGTVAGVASATTKELACVPGIGTARANAIRATLTDGP